MSGIETTDQREFALAAEADKRDIALRMKAERVFRAENGRDPDPDQLRFEMARLRAVAEGGNR